MARKDLRTDRRKAALLGILFCFIASLLFSCKADWPPRSGNSLRTLTINGRAFVVTRQLTSPAHLVSPAHYRTLADDTSPAPRGTLVTLETSDGRVLGETRIIDDLGYFQFPLDLDRAGIPGNVVLLLYTTLRNVNNQAIAGAPIVLDQTRPTPVPSSGNGPIQNTLEVQIDALQTFMMLTARAAAAERRDAIAVIQEARRRVEDTTQRQAMATMAENLMASTAEHPEVVNQLLSAPNQTSTGTTILDNAGQSAGSAAAQEQAQIIANAVLIAKEIINLAPIDNTLPTPAPTPTPSSGSVGVNVGIEDGPTIVLTPTPRPN